MAICTTVSGNQLRVDHSNPDPFNCPGWVIPSGLEYKAYFIAQPIEIKSSDILLTFTWGMGAVLSIWALGYVLGVGLALIRKA